MQYSLGQVIRKNFPTEYLDTALPNTTHKNALGVVVETYPSGGPIRTRELSGSIVYTRASKRYPHRSNFCAHTVNSLQFVNGVPSTWDANDLNPAHVGWTWQPYWDFLTSANAHNAAVPIALAQLGSNGLGKLQSNWTSYANSGFQKLQPDLTKLSLPNFLLDVKQIGSLVSEVHTLSGVVSGRSRTQLPVDIQRFKDLPKLDKFKTAAKLAAEKRLSYKFGWKPTIGDVKAMLDSIISLDVRLQAFKNNVGKILSYTDTIEKTDTWKVGQFNYGGDSHYQVNWAGYLNGKVQYHAKYQCMPLAVLGPLDETIRGYLDHFGVELNPQILWDYIPFSFVLDWFTGFGDWLSNFKVDALNLPIVLHDSSVSYKETYQVSSSVVINPNGYPTDVTSTTKPGAWVTGRRFYHRMPVDPTLLMLKQLGWRNPAGSQWTNAVSLATVLAL